MSSHATATKSLAEPGVQASRWLLGSPWAVGGIVLIVYGIWIAAFLGSGRDPRDFIHIGKVFVSKSNVSPVIKVDPGYRYPKDVAGYDGQFVYYIALDPLKARYYIDVPAYRYTRILYPIAARALALGKAPLVPYSMVLINLLSIAGGTVALAAWFRRSRLPPALALLFGFYPGLFIALRFDLTEALAFGLTALAIYIFDYGGRGRLVVATTLFALAGLTREITLIFALAFAASLLFREGSGSVASRISRNGPAALAVAGLSLAPVLIWHVLMGRWLGGMTASPGPVVQPVPFKGILYYWPWGFKQFEEIVIVMIPSLLAAALALWALRRKLLSVATVMVLIQVVLFVIFVHPQSFPDLTASARYAIGIVLAALLSIPIFDRLLNGRRTWLLVCALCWLLPLPWYLVKPFIVPGA